VTLDFHLNTLLHEDSAYRQLAKSPFDAVCFHLVGISFCNVDAPDGIDMSEVLLTCPDDTTGSVAGFPEAPKGLLVAFVWG